MTAGDTYNIVGGLKGRRAVAFLGGTTDDGIQINAFAAARVAANDTVGTFTAWFNVGEIASEIAIIGCGDASAVEAFYVAQEAGEIHLYAIDGVNVSYDMVTIGANIEAHEWHHVAIVQNAVKPKIYVDGVEFSLLKGTLTETDVTEPTLWFDFWSLIDGGHIGCADSVAGGGALTLEFTGAVSDVKYWNAILTDEQVLEDFQGINYTTDLISHWDMNGDFIDSVSGHDGTSVGDNILNNSYSEFTSRWRYSPAAPVLLADEFTSFADDGTGYAMIIKAA